MKINIKIESGELAEFLNKVFGYKTEEEKALKDKIKELEKNIIATKIVENMNKKETK